MDVIMNFWDSSTIRLLLIGMLFSLPGVGITFVIIKFTKKLWIKYIPILFVYALSAGMIFYAQTIKLEGFLDLGLIVSGMILIVAASVSLIVAIIYDFLNRFK